MLINTASLPPDIDETELSQQLRDRLAQFARILSIKIIHDAKGGVCAFLQCEVSSAHRLVFFMYHGCMRNLLTFFHLKDAVQASRIVTRTQQVPQIFMGRQLRFELARAFRSLWISYRKPMQFIPSSADENGKFSQCIQLCAFLIVALQRKTLKTCLLTKMARRDDGQKPRFPTLCAYGDLERPGKFDK